MPLQPIGAVFPLNDDVMGGVGPTVPITAAPAFARGSDVILFTGKPFESSSPIYRVRPDGTELRQLTHPPANTTDIAAWSPDATKFAVMRQSNSLAGGASLLVANADGSSLRTIWTGSGSAFPASKPSWRANGSQIVVCYEAVSDNGRGLGAAFVNADGSGHTLVPITVPSVAGGVGGVIDSTGLDSGMYLSPDGTTLAFSIYYAGFPSPVNFSDYPAICPAAGGTATVLTSTVAGGAANAWAQGWYADSQHLLCYRNGPSSDRVFKIKSDDTGETAIYTVSATFELGACLAPDETRIANADNNHGLLSIPIGGGAASPVVPLSPLLEPAVPDWGSRKKLSVGEVIARAAMGGIRRRGRTLGGVFAGPVRIVGNASPSPAPVVIGPPPATSYDEAVLATAGVTGYWPLSDTGGTVAHDLAGTNPGVYAGGFTLSQASIGSSLAARFDGVSGKVTVPDAPELSSDIQYSIEVWFQAVGGDNLNTAPGPLISKIDTDLGTGYAIELEDSGSVADFGDRAYVVTTWDAAGGITNTLGVSPVDDDPHYFAITADQTNVKMYVDGVLKLTASSELSATSTVNANPLRFAFSPRSETPGAIFLPGSGDFYYKGLLQRLAFYRSTVLSAGDIAAHWTAGSS